MHCDASRAWASVRACLQSPCRHFSDPADCSIYGRTLLDEFCECFDESQGKSSHIQRRSEYWVPVGPAECRLLVPPLPSAPIPPHDSSLVSGFG